MRRWPVLGLLIVFVMLSGALWGAVRAFHDAEGRQAFDRLPDYDYLPEIDALHQQGKFEEALALSRFVCDQPTYPQQIRACERAEQLWLETRSVGYRARSFGYGAWYGTAVNGWALAGATTADFFVVGDIRDLVVQGWRLYHGQETDALLMALSTLGVVTVALPSLDWGLSFSKMAVRLGAVSKRFTVHLLALTRGMLHTGVSAPLVRLCSHMRRLVLRLGPAKTLGILPLADHADDIATLARLADKHPIQTYALLKVGGRQALGMLAHAGPEATADLLRVARKGSPGLRLFQRFGQRLFTSHLLVGAGKAWRRGRLPQAVSLWLAAQTPALRLSAAVLLSAAWLLTLFSLWRIWSKRGRVV